MTTLTYAQIRAYASAAGAANADLAAAVAMAESSGNANAHNAIPPDDSYGLWQINMLGSLGTSRRKSLGISSNSQLYDPGTNARAMVQISSGGSNFSAWSTYTSGAYKKYLQGSSTSATDADFSQANSITDIPGETAAAAKDVAGIVIDAANWMVNPSNWLRVAYVVGGVTVVLVGLALLADNTKAGNAVMKSAEMGSMA